MDFCQGFRFFLCSTLVSCWSVHISHKAHICQIFEYLNNNAVCFFVYFVWPSALNLNNLPETFFARIIYTYKLAFNRGFALTNDQTLITTSWSSLNPWSNWKTICCLWSTWKCDLVLKMCSHANKGCMSLSTYSLECGHHIAWLCNRPWAVLLDTCMLRKFIQGFPFFLYEYIWCSVLN